MAEKGEPFTAEERQIRGDSNGPVPDGGCIVYGAEIKGRSAGGLLSFSIDRRAKPTPVCSQSRSAVLAQTGLCVEGIHQGDGLLGKDKPGDREMFERDREVEV